MNRLVQMLSPDVFKAVSWIDAHNHNVSTEGFTILMDAETLRSFRSFRFFELPPYVDTGTCSLEKPCFLSDHMMVAAETG